METEITIVVSRCSGGMEKKTRNDIAPPAKPNVMTNPVKKGSYGVHGCYMGAGTEFNYTTDPYDRPRELEMEERKKFKEKTAYFSGGKPFQTTAHARDCFDKTIYTDPEHLRGGSLPPPLFVSFSLAFPPPYPLHLYAFCPACYMLQSLWQVCHHLLSHNSCRYRGEISDKSLEGKPPFVPSQPPKSLTAFTGCFSKFPKAVPEPPTDEGPTKAGEAGKERPVFIPSSPPKSLRQKSIMFRNM